MPARNTDRTSPDPHRAVCGTRQLVFASLDETLVGLDTDGKTLTPGVGDPRDINDDSTVCTFRRALEPTISDGSPVEPKDVECSLLRLETRGVAHLPRRRHRHRDGG